MLKCTILIYRALILVISVLLFPSACNSQIESHEAILERDSPLDSTIAIIPYDTAYYWTFNKAQAVPLTDDDLKSIEAIIIDCVDDYNSDYDSIAGSLNAEYPWYTLKKENYIIELQKYKRQYVAVTNSDGHKMVWVNFFCDSFHDNWRESIIMFSDGGNCYFELRINLTTKQCYDFRVNGDA
jgi:hypothetical protein